MKHQLEQDIFDALSPVLQEALEEMTLEEVKQLQKDLGFIPEDDE
jgi:hypothetical protein